MTFDYLQGFLHVNPSTLKVEREEKNCSKHTTIFSLDKSVRGLTFEFQYMDKLFNSPN
jgi:hypothetical protein